MSHTKQSGAPANSDVDDLWAPRTLTFLTAVVAANLILDLALIAALVYVRWQGPQFAGWTSRYLRPSIDGLMAGSFVAQTVIMAIWTALFAGKSTTRLLAGTLVVMAGAAGLAVPIKTMTPLVDYLQTGVYDVVPWKVLADALSAVPIFLMLFYFAQIPFWIARRAIGMRITRDPDLQPPCDRALRLIELFAVLSFLGIAMAVARIAAPEGDVWLFVGRMGTVTGQMWILGFLLLLAMLATRRLSVGVIIVVGICELFAWSASEAYSYYDSRLPWTVVLCTFHGVALGIAFATLANGAAARAYGYRLIWTPARSKSSVTARQSAISTPSDQR